MNTFKELNNSEKARVIKLLVGMGFHSLQQIEQFYDEYQRTGGDIGDLGKRKPRQQEKRMTIRDWLAGRKGGNINKGVRNNVLYVDTGDKPYVKGSVAGLNPQPWVPSVDPVTGQPNPRPATFRYGDDGKLYTDPGSDFVPRKPMSQDEIVDFFWQMENPDHRGLNQENGMYYKYRDPNGKDWDVGPGLVIGKAIEDKPYYTKEELDRAAYGYHMDAMDKLAPLYDEKYGSGTFGNIDDRSKLVASDVMYRVGQNGVNPEKWPNMFDAINSGNTAMMLQQSLSKFKDKNNVQNYDNARVKRLGEYLYPGEFEYIFRNSLDPNLRVNKVEQKSNGGYLFSTGPEYPPVIQKVNKSKADFVKRLKDPDREYIRDWENPDMVATHKLSWADDGIVYPQVQNVDGRLVDFSRPPYDIWAGYDNAVRNGDTIHMTPQEAEWFTTHYKDYYPGFDEYKKGGSIHIKPENRGKFTALKKRTGHSASWFKKHGTPAQRKMATFALNARKWHHKHPDGGSLFDKWRQYMQNNTIDVPVTFNLPEVQVTAQAPKPGDANYDKYIANTYDAWQRGDIDINTLPTETRNRVRGYSGTIAAQHGMDEAAKVAGITAAIPAGIIGGISFAPHLMKGIDYLSNPLTTISKGLRLGSTPQIIAQVGDKLIDFVGAEADILYGINNLKSGKTRKGLTEIGLSALPLISNARQFVKARKMIQQIPHNIFDDAINKATKVYDEDYLNAYKIPQRRSFLTTPYDKNPEVMFGGFERMPTAGGFADQAGGFFKIEQPSILPSFLYAGINNSQKVLNNFVKKHYTPTVYHEVRHLYQPHTTSFFDKDVPLSLWNPSRGKYYTANTQHPLYKSSLYKFDKNINKGLINSGWTSSPAEFDAEMGLFRLKNNLGDTRFYDWNIEDQNRAIKTLSKKFHFNKNDTKQILNDMSSFGYFENGGPIKPFSYLPIPEIRY